MQAISSTTRGSARGPISVLPLTLLIGLVPASLRAAEVDAASAHVLFVEGRKLAASGDYAAACKKFEASFGLDPGIGTNFNLADCYEHIGRTASAWGRFLDVVAATRAANQPEREQVARERAATLEPRLSRLIIVVPDPVAGVDVRRDGIAVPETSWGMAVPVDPGEHFVEASAPGKIAWSSTIVIAATQGTSTLSVPPLREALVPKPQSTVNSPEPPVVRQGAHTPAEAKRRWSPAVVAPALVGAVALATGITFAIKFQEDNSNAQGLCADGICLSQMEKTQHDQLVASAYSDRNFALLGLGVGAAAVLTAAYFWWRPHHSQRKTSSPSVHASSFTGSVAPGGWHVGLEMTW